MRWLPVFIIAYVVLGLQLGTGDLLAYKGAQPNFVLILVVFIASNAPRDAALLSSLLLGLFHDMIFPHALGLYTFTYGLAGLLVAGSRQVAYSDHPLTHFFLTLGTGLVIAAILWIHSLIRPAGNPLDVAGVGTLPAIAGSTSAYFLTAVYSAFLSLPMMWLLAKAKPLLGFRPARQRY
ncbi:rod shape-determining protein MreD [Humisphaera borealis]|uniref:Rod shape-determining protein MreD n=1 Tax=Humisphaera borealis TaxID=2807512 RepID=A0A7M2WQV4_9BACT|nr:rod shape-determining protein MreD [Humisphaera borealis]QOV87789.1 rod shape-determining protein MreD [Humisphaera borealis]